MHQHLNIYGYIGYDSADFYIKQDDTGLSYQGYKGYIGLCESVSIITFYTPFNLLTSPVSPL